MKTTAEKSVHTQPTRQSADAHEQEQDMRQFIPPSVQPKLTVNSPDDPYEQEADAVADKVTQTATAPQRKEEPSLRLQVEEEEEELVQTQVEEEEEMIQAQAEEEEEEELVQRQTEEEEELVQTQVEEEEEEMIQAQAEEEEEVQRQCTDCEEEELVQTQVEEEEEEEMIQAQAEEEEMVQAQVEEEEEEIQRQCTDCEEEELVQTQVEEEEEMIQAQAEEEEEEELQRRTSGKHGNSGGTPAPSIVSEVVSSSGAPMDKGTRGFMEQRFGTDFSQVQIHKDDKAQRSASAISAQAYTYGSHIVFARGKYEPESHRGRHLIAHELTHVVQQDKTVKRRVDPNANTNTGTDNSAPLPNAEGPAPIPAEAAPAGPATNVIPTAAEADAAAGPPLPTATQVEPLMAPPPEELSPEAQARLRQSQRNAGTAADANAEMPPATELTDEARGGVTEPTVETDSRASGQLTASLSERLAPSPEIEELCENIRRVIREKRPPDEDSLLEADPEEAAQEAGTQLNDNIDSDVDRVEGEYDELDESPTGEPEQIADEVDLPPEEVGEPNLRAAGAAPDPLTEEEVSLEADVEASAQQMEDAGMSTPVADVIEDGPVAESRAVHEELEETAAEDPALVLAEQDLAIAGAQADMEELQAQALRALENSRTGTVQNSGTQQTEMVGSEEQQREALGMRAEEIFTNAQTQVNELLAPLTDTAMQMWETGKARIATEFEQHLARVQSWVDERHSGFGGGVVELWDDLTGLPGWVTDEYDDAERTFGDDICDLIREISLHVNGIIVTCEELIDSANREINDLFDNAPEELAEWAAAERERFQGRLDGLREEVINTQQSFNEDLANRAAQAVQEVREQVHALREAAKGLLGQIADAIAEFLEDPIRAIINGLLRLVGIEPAAFWALAARIEQVIEDIANDPLGFASNLMEAIGLGFDNFFSNFFTHLFEGFINWVFSGLGAVGVEIPQDFSLGSIITFFLQLMGITWERIRMLLARHIGEENVALLEQAYGIITDLIELGPEGVFELIKDQLDPQSILDQVIEMAVNFVIETLITQATIRIALLFNPVGAIAQAIEAIYRVLSWIFENAARIFTLVETVVNGIADIIAGNIAGMAATVENALAQILVPVIDFVAGYMGMGDLPEAVADMIRGLQNWVEGILDRVIGWLATQARNILSALGISEDADPEAEEEGEAGELEDTEVGEVMTFSADDEQHRLWVDTAGEGVEIMIRSTPMTVGAKLDEWNGKLNELSEEDQGQASSLIATARSQYDTTKREGAQAEEELEEAQTEATAESIAQANRADEETEAAQRTLKDTLSRLFELFGEEEDIDWKAETMTTVTEESGDTHKIYVEEEGDEQLVPYMESVKIKIETYLNSKKQEANQNNDDNAKTLVTEAERLLGLIETLSGQESTPDKTTIIGHITAMSRAILDLENLSEADFPDNAEYSNITNGKRAIHLSNDTIVATGNPSGNSAEYGFLQTAGHTANSSPDKWVRMHLIYDKLGGPPDPSNWVPAPNSVNTGSLVRGFENASLQLVTDSDANGNPNLVWAETKVTQFHPAHSRYQNLAGFAAEVHFKAGLHLPPQGNETDWRIDPAARVNQVVGVSPPPQSTLPSLSTATGTSLRSLDQVQSLVATASLFSTTTMGRIREARQDGAFASIRNFELRLIAVAPDNTRWVNKVTNEIAPGARVLYDNGYIRVG
jgi:hypothetical protein